MRLIVLFAIALIAAGCSDHAGHDHDTKPEVRKTRVELAAQPSPPASNVPSQLTFVVKTVEGEPVKELDIVHEKPMHVLIVSDDLAGFWHEHPEARPDGAYALGFAFPGAGSYRVFVDYKPRNGTSAVEPIDVEVAGTARPRIPLEADQELTRVTDGVRFTLKPSAEFATGNDVLLEYDLVDAESGTPVTDLENYLGEKAHFVIVSEDLKQFVHAHPLAQSVPNRVSAHVKFPAPGKYRIWAQFNRRAKITTVPFTVEVR